MCLLLRGAFGGRRVVRGLLADAGCRDPRDPRRSIGGPPPRRRSATRAVRRARRPDRRDLELLERPRRLVVSRTAAAAAATATQPPVAADSTSASGHPAARPADAEEERDRARSSTSHCSPEPVAATLWRGERRDAGLRSATRRQHGRRSAGLPRTPGGVRALSRAAPSGPRRASPRQRRARLLSWRHDDVGSSSTTAQRRSAPANCRSWPRDAPVEERRARAVGSSPRTGSRSPRSGVARSEHTHAAPLRRVRDVDARTPRRAGRPSPTPAPAPL